MLGLRLGLRLGGGGGVVSKIRWVLNNDLTQQIGVMYIWKSNEIFNFSKIFKF